MPATAGSSATGSYGPYRVIRPLGTGGMGTVLLAEDPRLGRFVALKTLSESRTNSPYGHDQLLGEARAAARLSHPNIATVHDVLDIAGQTVIVFEYVEGETLAERLRRGSIPVAEAIDIAAQLADGLAAAHAQGVIHRDLKPGNIMLAGEGRAKILDFGIARSVPSEMAETSMAPLTPAVGLFAGTPAYAAPEQWLGEPMGAATDLYALGVVLFEMLSGRRPFHAPSRMSLMEQVVEARRPRLRERNVHVPARLEEVVDAALSRDPARRPASAREVAHLLRAIARDLPDPAGAPVVASKRKMRVWWLATAAVLLASVAALLGALRMSPAAAADNLAPVVAVLPIANTTGLASTDYLTAGIAESLTTSLASLNGITVLSRAAVLSVWPRETEPSKVAQELGASYLVEASVQLSGDRVRLSVNLVRPDRSLAWGDSVEGALANVFELQSRLATALGRALSLQLSAADRAQLAQHPTKNPEALDAYWRGRALLERRDVTGNVSAALAAFDEAVRLDAKFAIAHAARGEALWARYEATRDAKAAQEAIDAGTTALRLDSDQPTVRYSLALSLAGSGRLDDAVDELQRALALQANYDDARRELGSVLARQGKLDEAVVEFRKAIAVRPNFAGHYYALGVSLLRAARYQEAAEAFERVIVLQPDSAGAYNNLGLAYLRIGRTGEALANFKRAIGISPTAQAYSNIGAVLHEQGDYLGAIDAYRKAIDLRPNAHITHRNLGDAYRRLGRARQAEEAYRRAIKLAEQDLSVNSRDARTMAALAVYLEKAGDDGDATRRLDQARKLAPSDFDVLSRAAVVHALAGRTSAALDALQAAIDRGYDRSDARSEEDFRSLQSDQRFKALVAPSTGSGGQKP